MSIYTEIFAPAKLKAAAKRFRLSPRELQCLVLLCSGETIKGTAGRLGISMDTVRFHMKGFRRKIKSQNCLHTLAILLLYK